MRSTPLVVGLTSLSLAGTSLAFNTNRLSAVLDKVLEYANDSVPTTTAAPEAPSATSTPEPVSEISCNGAALLCDRKYSNITLIGTHNSAFVGTGSADNQHISVSEQLDLGVRFMTAQTRDKDGGVQLCHSECALRDAGTLADYLKTVSDWINADEHKNEVVTILLTNGDGIDIQKYGDLIKESGLDQMAFTPEGGKVALDEWPTLRELIEANTRIIFMMDYHADTSKVAYILPEFDHIWETPFGVEDPNFPDCSVNRPSGADPATMMSLVNHVLNKQLVPDLLGGLFGDEGIQIPAADEAGTTNSKDSLTANSNTCTSAHGKLPNILLIDFVETGDAMAVQNMLNGLE